MGGFFGSILSPIMRVVFNFVGSYGISIIIFTVITKLIIFPATYKQFKGTAKMAVLSPKINSLKKQYGKNMVKLQEEQQKLFKEEGYSQFSGCLPALIQLPILYGVFDVVRRPLTHILKIDKKFISEAEKLIQSQIKLGKESEYYEILNELNINSSAIKGRPELSILNAVKDDKLSELFAGLQRSDLMDKISEFQYSFMGIDFSQTPTLKPETWDKSAFLLALIPICSGIIQLIMTLYTQAKQRKVNPDAAQQMGSMKFVLYGMPLFSVGIGFTMPAGVGFYWIWSSLFSFLITIALYAYFNPERTAVMMARDKERMKNKKPSRLQQMLDEQREMMMQQAENGTSGSTNLMPRLSEEEEEKMSRSELAVYNRKKIAEARRRIAEKYGEEYNDSEE